MSVKKRYSRKMPWVVSAWRNSRGSYEHLYLTFSLAYRHNAVDELAHACEEDKEYYEKRLPAVREANAAYGTLLSEKDYYWSLCHYPRGAVVSWQGNRFPPSEWYSPTVKLEGFHEQTARFVLRLAKLGSQATPEQVLEIAKAIPITFADIGDCHVSKSSLDVSSPLERASAGTLAQA